MKECVVSKEFYVRAVGEDAYQPIKYFAFFIGIISFLSTVVLIVMFISFLRTTHSIADLENYITQLYPEELVLTWKNGIVSSNVSEPYAIPFPEEWLPEDERFDNAYPVKNLIVINTQDSVDPADFKRFDTMVILGGDAVGTYDSRKGKVQIQNFSQFDFSDFSLNKDKVAQYVGVGVRFLKAIVVVIFIVLPSFIFLILGVKYCIYLLFGALIIWGIAKFKKVDITYGQAYKIGFYLLTLPICIEILSFYVPLLKTPFVFTAVLAYMTYRNLESPIIGGVDRLPDTTTTTTNPTSVDPLKSPISPEITENRPEKLTV
jgi:hypothetical protein